MFQYHFILLSMPPILGLPLEADSKFLSAILRCEKWFTLFVTGPIKGVLSLAEKEAVCRQTLYYLLV